MKFKYQARNKNGELQVGFVDAASKDAAVSVLTSHDLFVLSIASAERRGLQDSAFRFINRVKLKDLMIMTRQLATLIESELPLGDALKILHQQTRNVLLKEAVFGIYQDVESGLSLSQALERQRPIFSDFYVSMIRSAEVTGRLEQSLQFMALYLEKEVQWKGKVTNAMIYPAVLVVLFIVVMFLMVVLVFPKIEPIFAESNLELPMISKIVFSFGKFAVSWWWAMLLVVIGSVFILIDYFRSQEGKAVGGQLLLQLPIFGKLYSKMYITRFSQSLSVLIKGGIPVTQAIEVAGDTIDNVVYRELFSEMARQVREGALFSQSLLARERFFPPMVGQMVAVGETTGRLDEMMLKIADFYEKEVNDIVGNLSELIQPILITVIGGLVGVLFASILMPIFNLAQSFGN
jgi:type IV pilus assembly protein PilC